MYLIKAIVRRIYWVLQELLEYFEVSLIFLDQINFRGFRISKFTPESKILEFLYRFKPVNNGYELIRVGGMCDGGYLIPNDIGEIINCFSAGCDMQWTFERDLEKLIGARSYIIDSEEKRPPDLGINQKYTAGWLGTSTNDNYIRFEDWLAKSGIEGDHNLLLQMDIEGFEWECLSGVSVETLNKFRIIVVEFHGVKNICNYKLFLEIYSPVIDKIMQYFDVVHFHPNNCCGSYNFSESFAFPNVFEVTFHRKDRAIKYLGFRDLPNSLDVKNVSMNEDLSIIFP